MRRNSKPVAFPPEVSRCMASISPPEGGSQTSSLSVPRSSPDQEPASHPSCARAGEPGPAAGQSGVAVSSSAARKIIDSLRGSGDGARACARGRGLVLDEPDTEQCPQSPGSDERPCERPECLERRCGRQPRISAELAGEVRLVD